MFRAIHIIRRLQSQAASAVLIIIIASQPVFSQAGVGSVITVEPPFMPGTFNSVIFDTGIIPAADIYEICFFDSADTDIYGSVAFNPAGRDILETNLNDLVEGRIYGCFIRGLYDQSSDTVYSDTLFSTGVTLSHDILITNSTPKVFGTDDNAAVAQTGTTAHNYPNPFNPKEEETKIVFESDLSGSITMLIYDLFGHLVYERTDADASDLRWNGYNSRNELVTSGGYICLLKVGDKIVSRHKIAVIK